MSVEPQTAPDWMPDSLHAAAIADEALFRGEVENEPPAAEQQPATPPPAPVHPATEPPPAPTQQAPKQPEPTGEMDVLRQQNQQLLAELTKSRQQYASLQGKYTSEDKARHELEALQRQVQDLQARNQQLMEQAKAQPPAPVDARAIHGDSYAYLADALGEKELNTLTANIHGRMMAELNSRLEGVRQPLEQNIQQSHAAMFASTVRSLVGPEFDAIINDPNFDTWASMPIAPGYDDITRTDALNRAKQSGDAGRMARILNEYKAFLPAKPGTVTPVLPVDLRSQVLPSGSSTGAPPAMPQPPDQKVWSVSEFMSIMDGITAGRIDGARAAELTKQLDRAQAEGRIR